ncbi:flagellin [Natronorubrum sp. JWXQ-INN-674]|uniref:Flagellin n=1 Tax=Natronorubrum halalkaliphilum TaxID=2691917 RepID=A0A6B0VJT5_9EURY|nr:flagellin [Natronorubrum halalkaliphilum]MXV61804.1 flagellin [Natronorubrum halalkaliphilum]
MSSVSATHLIMFIGSLVIASAVAGTVIIEVGNVSDSIEMRGSAVAEEIDTEIAIISDESQPDAMVNDDGSVSVLAKNIGNKDIPGDPRYIDVVVDGSYAPVESVERLDADSNGWDRGGVVEITTEADQLNGDGDTDVAVIVNGNEDAITFYWSE